MSAKAPISANDVKELLLKEQRFQTERGSSASKLSDRKIAQKHAAYLKDLIDRVFG